MKKIDTEKLTGYLIEGITLLKEIRERNQVENDQIDAYLEEILKDLADEEEKKKEDEGDEGKPEDGSDKAESKKEAQEREAKEKKMADAFKKLSDMLRAKEKVEKEEASESEKKLAEKLKALQEAAVEQAMKQELDERMKKSDPRRTGIAVEDGTTSSKGGSASAPKKIIIKKRSEVKPVEELPASQSPSEPPVIVDEAPVGKVWCTVCNEYHEQNNA